ncbi:STAS domain-containing protein [Nonomuraea endophytica]|uniref:Anti-sigma factor antagonist n=1 Tax=Nonomuraea endophytica TaxID=714136 RepID=A0A7W7ZXR9_9ACTN|nr:STAS domain-containing protein [Nonomuraea endophytica]MBB5075795.1 anti-anti-sigma factor [Nonomuraea endophytica]
MPTLLLTCRPFDGLTLVGVAGELDATNAADLGTYIEGQHPEWALPLVLDLAALTFMDSTGLHLLIGLHHREHEHGGRLHLAAPHARVSRLLQITGTDRLFHTHPSLQRALTAARLTLSSARGA